MMGYVNTRREYFSHVIWVNVLHSKIAKSSSKSFNVFAQTDYQHHNTAVERSREQHHGRQPTASVHYTQSPVFAIYSTADLQSHKSGDNIVKENLGTLKKLVTP